ncbi:MAG TPA: hypothetical protein VIZ00_05270 [Streptosporangiaceae bacterium]
MAHDHSDDDVIVISEDEDRYEARDENAPVDPAGSAADDELAANDQDTRAVPSPAGRFGTTATPGEAAASEAADTDLDPDLDTDPDAHPATVPVTPASSTGGTGTGTVNGNGSAIPMPGSAAAPAASTTPADGVIPAGPTAASDGNWPQIQALFVDDPLAAVQQAADVVGGAMAALTAAANNREQTLRGGWQGDHTGTEELRTALREYRDLAGRLSTLARDL